MLRAQVEVFNLNTKEPCESGSHRVVLCLIQVRVIENDERANCTHCNERERTDWRRLACV